MMRLFLAAVLNGYAAILFLDGAARGFIIMLATFLQPASGLGGLLGALTAVAGALLFGYPRELVRSGLYSVNPLLVGMTITFFIGLTPTALMLIVPAALFTLVVGTVLGDVLYRNYRVGALSLPFTLVATLIALAVASPAARPPVAAALPVPPALADAVSATANILTSALPVAVIDLGAAFCRSLGAVFFLPATGFGLVLFIVLLAASRVMAVQAMLGFVTGCYCFLLAGGEPGQLTYGMAGFNFCLTAIAVGGYFFLPGRVATLHAVAATAVTALLTLLAAKLLTPHGLPVFAWPFNFAVIPWIAAMHLRPTAHPPHSTAGLSGPPEETRARADLLRRLPGERVVLRLPVIGEWTVTQGHDGEPTHRPPWSQAWDFEVLDNDGFPFRVAPHRGRAASPEQAALENHFCFTAPVVAAADGMVIAAHDCVVDNLPGATNPAAAYGNYLVIRHLEGFCSLYAHLQCRSLLVGCGALVRAGQPIARCGASGRAPRPHLHFQVQADHRPDSPTFAAPFSQFVRRAPGDNGLHYVDAGIPLLHDRVTAIDALPGAQPAPRATPGQQWRFTVCAGRRNWRETWLTDLDLWGGIRVRADQPAAELLLRVDQRGMAAVAFSGSQRGALYHFFLGNSRVPAHLAPALAWRDRPGAAYSLPGHLALPLQLLLPFLQPAGAETRFTCASRNGFRTITAANSGREITTVWNQGDEPQELTVTRDARPTLSAARCC